MSDQMDRKQLRREGGVGRGDKNSDAWKRRNAKRRRFEGERTRASDAWKKLSFNRLRETKELSESAALAGERIRVLPFDATGMPGVDARILVNYLRHERIDPPYDDLLRKYSWAGADGQVKRRVLRAIAAEHPHLADECARQESLIGELRHDHE